MGNEQSSTTSKSTPASPTSAGPPRRTQSNAGPRNRASNGADTRPPPVPAKSFDAETVSLPPPYALVDPVKSQSKARDTSDSPVARKITSKGLASVIGRPLSQTYSSLAKPPNTAPLPSSSSAAGQTVTTTIAKPRRPSSMNPLVPQWRPQTTGTSQAGPSRVASSPQARTATVSTPGQGSRSSAGPSRRQSSNGSATADGVGGFRSQMPPRRTTPPTTITATVQGHAGSRHTHVKVLPPITPGDVLGNPMRTASNSSVEGTTVSASPTRTMPQARPQRDANGQRTKASVPQRRSSVEDPLEYLRKYDTVCVLDDSSSMGGLLWLEARDALAGIADVAARYDADGVDIHFLNNPTVGRNMKTGAEVKRLFDRVMPQGITPTGEKLEELLLDYILKLEAAKAAAEADGEPARWRKEIKPVNFLVITDGQPTDDPEPVIVSAAKRLDEGHFPLSQVGIQFVQIGSDPSAAEALRELDDDLASGYGVRDMVDTVPFSADSETGVVGTDLLVKTLLGGINRRQDRRKASTS